MKCQTCKHWQGTKYSIWGDCYRVISQFVPEVVHFYKEDSQGNRTYFEIPFDPHYAEQWKQECLDAGVDLKALREFYSMRYDMECNLYKEK